MGVSYRIIIRFLSGAREGQSEAFPLDRHESLYVGRDPGCDIRFDASGDDVVSRTHALIEWGGESIPPRFTITDLLSSNGTYVDGASIASATPLGNGSTVEFGRNGPSFSFGFEQIQPTSHREGHRIEFAESQATRQMPRVKD